MCTSIREALRGAALIGVVLGTLACAKNGELGGSAGGSYNLNFEDVRGFWLNSELVIVFEKSVKLDRTSQLGNHLVNQPVRMVIDTERQTLTKGTDIPILGPSRGLCALDVSHYVLHQEESGLVQDPGFPPVQTAMLHFDELGKHHGQELKGDAIVTFEGGKILAAKFDLELGTPH